jgi:hypothetical protein
LKHPSILILEVRLLHTHPSVWRIIEVKSNTSLHDLHRIIQVSMGWTNSHLYSFIQEIKEQSVEYNLPEYANPDEIYHGNNPVDFKLKDIFFNEGDKLLYLYDFGDYWEHEVILKGWKYEEAMFGLPACTAGAMACPPEDVGGVHGYKLLLDAIENKQKNELEEYRVWLGYKFDPYDFSADKLLYLSKRIRRIK